MLEKVKIYEFKDYLTIEQAWSIVYHFITVREFKITYYNLNSDCNFSDIAIILTSQKLCNIDLEEPQKIEITKSGIAFINMDSDVSYSLYMEIENIAKNLVEIRDRRRNNHE